jgi:hypothetical protein
MRGEGLAAAWALGGEGGVCYRAVQEGSDPAAGVYSEYGGCIQAEGEGGCRGVMRVFDEGYPAALWKGADAVVIFRATFPAEALGGRGIRRVHLLNGTARCFATARFEPAAEAGEGRGMRIIWELAVGGEEMEISPEMREWVRGLPGPSGAE